MDELYARRAVSFGSVAAEYALHRPDYPDEAAAWALAPLHNGTPNNGAGSAPRLDAPVLDLGAGTGKLTAAILRCGVPATQVLAVDPDEGMRAELSRLLPEIIALRGSAEQIPAETGVVAAVLVGQAFHWFDPGRALPEIARVLRPGGVIARIGNIEDDSVGWVAKLVETAQAARPVETIGQGFDGLPKHPAFGKSEQRQFSWHWPRTIDSLVKTTSTHSWALVGSPQERDAALLAIRRFLEQHPATRDGAFELPMRTVVHRAIRHR